MLGAMAVVAMAIAPLWAMDEDVSGLVKALGTGDESARLKAIDALGDLGPKAAESVKALAERLSDSSSKMRAHAARALGKIGKPASEAAAALFRLVGDPDAMVRRESLRALREIRPGPKVVLPLFVKLLKDPNPSVKMRAMEALHELGDDAVGPLVECLGDESTAHWACLVVGELGPKAKAAVPALTKLLDHAAPDMRQQAILSLAAIGPASEPAAGRLAQALEDPLLRDAATFALVRIGKVSEEAEAKIRANAKADPILTKVVSMWALAKLHPEDKTLVREAAGVWVDGLKSDREPVRTAAARAINDIRPGPKVMVPLMEKALENAKPEVVEHVLNALATVGAPAVPNLIEALEHEKVRPMVAYVLGRIGPQAEAATQALAELLGDANPATRREAAIALAKIGPAAKQAVPALIEAMETRRQSEDYGPVYALGSIGPAAAPAKPALLKAMSGKDETLALFSAWALALIDPGDAEVAKKSVSLLRIGLADPEAGIRHQAAVALGKLGPLAKPAAAALQEAQRDSDPQVGAAAAAALKAIGE
jgi:HEAT repeat protein